MKANRALWFLLVVLFCGLTAPRSASAISYVMMEDSDLFDQAQGVVLAEVLDALPARDGDFETRYRLDVLDVIAGPALKGRPILALPGTFDAPTINAIVPGVPQLVPGGRLLLFYERGSGDELRPQQLTLGLFGEQHTPAGPVWVRALEQGTEYGKNQRSLQLHAPRQETRFLQWLRDRAQGVEREADYLLPAMTRRIQPKYAFSTFATNPDVYGRFFVFDQGETMQWTAEPDGQADTTHSTSSLQAAIAAWMDDPGSKILLGYGGTATYPPNSSNRRVAPCAWQEGVDNNPNCYHGHVTWNDPEGMIAGSFNCGSGGTLAIGGSSAVTPVRSFNGLSWFTRFSAYVIVQDGAGCAMDRYGGADGAELLTHEIGHGLALGHACGVLGQPSCSSDPVLNDSIMRPVMHGGGRGARLGADDQAAMAIAYPAPANATGPSITPLSPANNSTTSLGGGAPGASVNGQITFNSSGGSNGGTTQLVCSVNSGSISITGNASQTVPVGGSVQAVGVRFVLTNSAQNGQVKCTATPQGGSAATYTYNFTANAGSRGPTVSPLVPAHNSTTHLGGGAPGAAVTGQITFQIAAGSGSGGGTTQLACSVNSGSVSITGNASQTVPTAGPVQAVGVKFTLTNSAQNGQVKCTSTPQNGSASTWTYNFTADAATQGPAITPWTPPDNSTTSLGGGIEGDSVTGQISFHYNNGSGGGTTQLNCGVKSGTVSIASNASQTVPTAGPVKPVGVKFTLTGAAQSGEIECNASVQNGATVTYTYTFTALAGVVDPDRIFRDGFGD